ncbi:MAG TPA: MarR family transcriptional regulator [Bacteroidia bacterium]|jgi:DNA-binding MarR family transcriptional regulator
MPVKKKLDQNMPMGKFMGALTKSYFGALSKKMEHLGIDRHFSTLIAIDTAERKCTQQYLSDLLCFDKVSMVRMLDYLVGKEMITRTVNPKDRREHIIDLTPKARKVMPEVRNGIKEMNTIAFKGINKQDREMFYACMAGMLKNLENLPANEVDIKLKKK